MVKVNIEEQQQSVEQLVTLMSLAAQRGNETALKVMDEVQTILTTDWDDLPIKIKEQMAYVTAQMLLEPVSEDEVEE